MLQKETYIRRRKELKKLLSSGIVIFFGNNASPANYPANGYFPFRQDSSFLYYFGLDSEGLVGVIDLDEDVETLFGDDIDINDIVWFGSVDSVRDMATSSGVDNTAPMSSLKVILTRAKEEKRKIHFLPPYRHDTMLLIEDLLDIPHSEQKKMASQELISSIVKMRSKKDSEEIIELEDAASIGYKMHTLAMKMTRPGLTERRIAGHVSGIAYSLGAMPSFPTIFTQHGEIMHGIPTWNRLESGRLVLCDAGAENKNSYCSDNTRTFPVNGKFTLKQLEIYKIVEACHDHVLDIARPGVRYLDVHLEICRQMSESLKELGIMKGDIAEAVKAGAHAIFMPHGLGHMMGLDVHDMEGLGQENVGFDAETLPSEQFGTSALRMGRRLEEGMTVTDEPGIYFIPQLIEEWKAQKLFTDFINYDVLETYKNFGGIRIEDDILITQNGCRFLGEQRIPYHPKDVEEYMAEKAIE